MKKGTWLLVSWLIALSLLLAACAPAAPAPTAPTPAAPAPTAPTTPTPTTPAAPTTPAGPEMVKITLTKLDGTKMEKLVQKPKYGGVFNIGVDRDVPNYDPTLHLLYLGTYDYTNDYLYTEDPARGPAGTEETDYLYSARSLKFSSGIVATSYELPDNETIIYHIRKGIHFWNMPPVNGRELNADDVAFSLKRYYDLLPDYPNPKSRGATGTAALSRPKSVTATDKWTVVIKVDPSAQGSALYDSSGQPIIAPEIVPKSGETWAWNRNVGFGAWILKDVVPSISWTYVRNPNYWNTDFAFPENHLPYADGFKGLLITDTSTLFAAMRTGKIDTLREISRDDADPLLQSVPALKVAWKLGSTTALYYRVDKPELPWYNVKVRQALQMAIDREAINKNFRAGQAAIYSWPVQDRPDLRALGAAMPFEELPANVQELFKYNPDKAKQLLAEAGYPNGFTMEVVTGSRYIDEASIVQFYLDKIGVNLVFDIKEPAVLTGLENSFTHKEGVFTRVTMNPAYQGFKFAPGENLNMSVVNDPRTNEALSEFKAYYARDDAKAFAALRRTIPYVLEQAWMIQMPTPQEAMIWWPWVQRYDGINSMRGRYSWTQWAWVDQDLKKSMGY